MESMTNGYWAAAGNHGTVAASLISAAARSALLSNFEMLILGGEGLLGASQKTISWK
jgi:hypothetical protein